MSVAGRGSKFRLPRYAGVHIIITQIQRMELT